MLGFYANINLKEFERTLTPEARRRWFKAKGIANPTNRNHREFEGAKMVCLRKRRYHLVTATLIALKLGIHAYRCPICGYWHTSRQSVRDNKQKHLK